MAEGFYDYSMKPTVVGSEELQGVARALAQEFRWRRPEEIQEIVAEGAEALGTADNVPALKNFCRERLEGRMSRAFRHFGGR